MHISKDKIREIMKERGITTQTELAELMGINKQQLSVILSDKFNPIKSNTQVLCEILDVDLTDIISDTPEQPDGAQLSMLGETKEIKEEQFIDVTTVVPGREFTVVELFAGAGGLALGLDKAGFNTLALNEIDKFACETLRKNRPEWNVIEEDIINVAERGIKSYIGDIEVDLLSGGYPCQSFSYAGMGKGLDDVRGTMFYYYAQILNELKPKMFLAENVRGLVSHDKGKTLEKMIQVFEETGYKVQWQVLNAKDYGVAQKRQRIVIIGIRNDLDIEYKYPKEYEYKPVLRDALKDVPDSDGSVYPQRKKEIMEMVPPGGCWIDLPEEVAKEYMKGSYYLGGGKRGMARRISWDEPSLTLTTSPAQKQTERCHPDETRPFTMREYARIQSFPDGWQFAGALAAQYKQIGNAVPVEFGRAIGLSIINALNQTVEE